MEFTRYADKVDVTGTMQLLMNDMGSRLSSIKPLGSYQLSFDWRGQNADIILTTNKGPMMLSGNGSINSGRFQFSGKAFADTGQEEGHGVARGVGAGRGAACGRSSQRARR